MEITSFALGMVAMIAIALVVVVIVGMVRVNKMKETMNNIERYLDNTNQVLDNRIGREVNDLYREIHKNASDTDQVFKNFETHIKDISEEKDRQISEAFRVIETDKKEILSYVDSRLDKLVNNLNK